MYSQTLERGSAHPMDRSIRRPTGAIIAVHFGASGAPAGKRGTMGLSDKRDVPVSTTNQAALDKFEAALAELQTYRGDPVATIDEALATDPDFVLGHCFKAQLFLLATERKLVPTIAESVAAAEALADRANDRERGHVAAARAWLDGNFTRAIAHWEDVLLEHPRDILALQVAHVGDFFTGNAANLRDRVARVLPAWSDDVPGYGYVLGMHAFGLEECGDYGRAEAAGTEAVSRDPRDAWAIHAVTHVLEMQGRLDDGILWLTSREDDWAPDTFFAVHNWWHLALYHLDQGDIDRVLALYDKPIRGERSDVVLDMLDASALLWRLHLMGIDVGDRWRELADAWEPLAEDAYYAFNDMHAAMAFVGDGRDGAGAKALAAQQRLLAAANGTAGDNVMMTRDVGYPACQAIAAFGRGDHGAAVEALLPIRYHAQRFGGSHAQRDVMAQTLIEAALRDRQFSLARALLAERTALRSTSPHSWTLTARACDGLGDATGPTAARDRAGALRPA